MREPSVYLGSGRLQMWYCMHLVFDAGWSYIRYTRARRRGKDMASKRTSQAKSWWTDEQLDWGNTYL